MTGVLSTEDGHLPCEQDPAAWFSPEPATIQRAKHGCSLCPRREDCLTQALATEELMGHTLTGVHGGLTPAERNRLKA